MNGEIDESKEDSITYGLIKQLNTYRMESHKPINIEDKFPDSPKNSYFLLKCLLLTKIYLYFILIIKKCLTNTYVSQNYRRYH